MNYYRLETRITAAMAEARVPGLALAIVANREIVYARGFGVTSVEAGGVPVTPETLFQIGSVTKPLTGTMIVALSARGPLDLDAPVTTYLPTLTLGEPDMAPQVTPRHLLSHTSGLPWDQITPARLFGSRDPAGLATYVERELPRRPLGAPPGMLFNYSNPGFNLAARVAEVATGTPYTELMARRLFEPLGMRDTTFDPTLAMTRAVAQAHDLTPSGALRVRRPAPDNSAQYPAAFAYSTVLDLARFARAQLGAVDAGGVPLLDPDAIAMMREAHADRYEGLHTRYGLGFYLDHLHGVMLAGHPGGINTLGSQFWLAPERGAGVVMLFNRSDDFERPARRSIDEILVELLDLAPVRPLPTPALDPQRYRAYTGSYVDERGAVLTVRALDNEIVVEREGAVARLAARRDDLFTAHLPLLGRMLVAGFPPRPAPGAYVRFDGRLYRREAKNGWASPSQCG